jgi:hypothetical protein
LNFELQNMTSNPQFNEGIRQRMRPELPSGDRTPEINPAQKGRAFRRLPTGSTIVCLLLTAISLWTRLYKIQRSAKVVWDEAHFGIHL